MEFDDLNETLPQALQSAVDRKLSPGEGVLMSLAGATGEGLVVTDQRVIILREQLPTLLSPNEVDCFTYVFEEIRGVRVEDAAGGGRLLLDLVTIPVDEKDVTLYFPSGDLSRFEEAAARVRLLAEQTRGLEPVLAGPAGSELECPHCAAAIQPRDNFCGGCGSPLGRACGLCGLVLREGARFCYDCGAEARWSRTLECGSCGHRVAPGARFCPACGTAQVAGCPECGAPVLETWNHCEICGSHTRTDVPAPGILAALNGGPEGLAEARAAAESHNSAGLKHFEEDRFEEAAREFKAALDLAPGTPLYHCNLGLALTELGREEEALEEYATAMRIDPTDPTPHLNRGYFHADRGDLEDARACWLRVLELAPGTQQAAEAERSLNDLEAM
jgi:hypothetical protein